MLRIAQILRMTYGNNITTYIELKNVYIYYV